tara:strand:+ start:617 stop:1261 length:645 start_codon:yes stop_codon:yes gene_type:complete
MGASVGIGGLIVGTSMLVVFALAVSVIDLRMDSSLETLESANEPLPILTIDSADLWEGAVVSWTIVDPGANYVNGTLSTVEPGGFTATFTVDDITGGIDNVVITNHGNYSSTPTIQVDSPPLGVTTADIDVDLGTIIDAEISNTGPTVIPINEIWLFLDGAEPKRLSSMIFPAPTSANMYSGETLTLQWRGLGTDTFDTIALSSHGYNIARALD